MNLRSFLSLLIVLPLAACPAPGSVTSSAPTYLAQPQVLESRDAFIHASSGMTFPIRVDDFRRVNLVRYDRDGLDMSAGYNSTDPSAPVIGTVYVYPAPRLTSIGSPADVVASARERLCQNEFASRKAEIVQAHPDAKLLGEKEISLPRGTQRYTGKQAGYIFMMRLGGSQVQVSSHLYVFCNVGEKWTVKYRFTMPIGVPLETVSSFIDHLPWTISGMQ